MASTPGQPRQPTPEEFIRALRGGNRRDSGRDRRQEEAQSRMTVGVDKRRNALIVAAPDGLFEEVKRLVAELDQIDPELYRESCERIISEKAATLKETNHFKRKGKLFRFAAQRGFESDLIHQILSYI